MKDYIRLLYAYNNWANQRILDTCEELTQEQFLAGQGISSAQPSIRDTLVHTLSAQELWLARCGGVSPTRLLDPQDFGALALIRQYWDQVEQHTRAYIDAVEENVLRQVMEYTSTKGKPFANLRWQTLVHQVNHATQHRAEVALLLARLNRSPGDLDLIVHIRNVAG
ncbi:MAG: DinB family protein [Chloroflexi bacterium]|nr:DinB family protein [Chloroflexota bacterium]